MSKTKQIERPAGGGELSETHSLRFLSASPEKIRAHRGADGRNYQVVPVVALTEGVFQCANCPDPELYLATEFGRIPDAWNGRPVTLGHPMSGNQFISAGAVGVWENEVIGFVRNARMEGDKLKVEAWIDEEMVAKLGDRADRTVNRLEEGDRVEVSVGAFIDRQPSVGQFKGRRFDAVQRNFVPDHLAILPADQIGACSWQDGCGGPRVNAADRPALAVNCNGDQACSCCATPTLAADAISDRTRRDMLRMALGEKLDTVFFTIEDIFDDAVIYREENAGGAVYRRAYTIDETSGTVTLSDETERGAITRDFMPITVQRGADEMDRETAVNQLIANKGAPWDEQDRDTLISMPDKTFEKVVAANTEPAGGDAGDGGDAAGEEARPRPSADKPAEQPQATAPASSAAASEISFADLLKRAPDDVREVLDEGVALRAARRKRLIDGLVGCERCKFTQPELEACTTRHLEHLADLAQLDQPSRHADYSGRAPATSQSRSPFKSAPKGVDWTNQAAI